LIDNGIPATEVPKVRDDPRVLDMMRRDTLHLAILLPRGARVGSDGYKIRRTAVEHGVPYVTTVAGSMACVSAIRALRHERPLVHSLCEYYDKYDRNNHRETRTAGSVSSSSVSQSVECAKE